ncbi:glycosyltransferase [Flavobacterium sp.]|uniref:glycosyltransferase n=1 Tax=Flavobacterium sp. TaxID=239 RepID=UPI00120F0474|nr:glycosyltransferase [Flavobacterium sp.]RZJ70859.1 MAG: glycosyltransferase family 2 protein [Flavobacterium sp.]
MRQGHNPHKDKREVISGFFHQVIIPVYIPEQGEYFRDGPEILSYCLESLFKTVHEQTFITVINNGSSARVANYLDGLFADGKIHELIHSANIGKLNAVLKGLIGHKFDLVTISDADVLFLDGWQKAASEVFSNFAKAGAVCTTPSSKSFRNHTANIWAKFLFSKKIGFSAVENPDALQAFAHSIGNPNYYSKAQLDRYLTLSSNGKKAVLGAGHFCATYRGDIFESLQKRFSEFKLGGKSENDILDKPVQQNGFYRLSTIDNFTCHMGNVREDWMPETLSEVGKTKPVATKVVLSAGAKPNFFEKIVVRCFTTLLTRKNLAARLLVYKGMSAADAQKYVL